MVSCPPRLAAWWLPSLIAALLLVGCPSASGPSPSANPSISAPEAYAQTQAGALTLIDIRTPPEWRETGIADGALRIDMLQPGGADGFVNAVLAEVGTDRAAPIALICRTGNRTAMVQRELLARGFTQVYDVSEGMAGSRAGPGWLRRGLPVKPCPTC